MSTHNTLEIYDLPPHLEEDAFSTPPDANACSPLFWEPSSKEQPFRKRRRSLRCPTRLTSTTKPIVNVDHHARLEPNLISGLRLTDSHLRTAIVSQSLRSHPALEPESYPSRLLVYHLQTSPGSWHRYCMYSRMLAPWSLANTRYRGILVILALRTNSVAEAPLLRSPSAFSGVALSLPRLLGSRDATIPGSVPGSIRLQHVCVLGQH